MNLHVFSSLSAAQTAASQVDTALGYPRTCTSLGVGLYNTDPGDPTPLVAPTYFYPIAHPSGTKWGYIANSVSTPLITSPPTAVAIDPTWYPLVQVIPAAVGLPTSAKIALVATAAVGVASAAYSALHAFFT